MFTNDQLLHVAHNLLAQSPQVIAMCASIRANAKEDDDYEALEGPHDWITMTDDILDICIAARPHIAKSKTYLTFKSRSKIA